MICNIQYDCYFDFQETDLGPVVRELVRDKSYEHFAKVIENKVEENVGAEPSWQQVAMLFKMSQAAIKLASFGPTAAVNVKEWTLRYFEDKFAGWIVGQGGWVCF